jgi:hypothetical protein
MIPLEIDDEGFLRGIWPEVTTRSAGGVETTVAETPDYKGSGITYSADWFQYCGVEGYQGIDPSYDSDNYFRVGSAPGYGSSTARATGCTSTTSATTASGPTASAMRASASPRPAGGARRVPRT